MAITREEVLHVARLARLELSDEEVTRFREQLEAILEAVSKVSELDLADVPPTSHPLEIANAWAEDEPRPCLSLDDAFANAPDREGDLLPDTPGVNDTQSAQSRHRHGTVFLRCFSKGGAGPPGACGGEVGR